MGTKLVEAVPSVIDKLDQPNPSIDTSLETRDMRDNYWRSRKPSSVIDEINGTPQPAPLPGKHNIRKRTEITIGLDQVHERALELFNEMDTDGDGFLSKKELASAVTSEKYKGQNAQIVAALYKNCEHLSDLNDDKIGVKIDGITRKDLYKFHTEVSSLMTEYTVGSVSRIVLKDNFQDLDNNSDGYLSRQELESAKERYSDTTIQKLPIHYALSQYEKFEQASNDEFGAEDSGITYSDIEAYDREKERFLIGDRARAYLQQNFHWIDRDKDGFVTKHELNKAIVHELGKGDDAWKEAIQFLKYLIRDFDFFATQSNDEIGRENYGITQADINKAAFITKEERLIARTIGTANRVQEKAQQGGMCYDLYRDFDHPEYSIQPDAVKQGTIGDCYFLAPVAALAHANPMLIAQMIRENGDGTCTVTFPGDPSHPVTVKMPTEAELGLYNGASEYGTWAAILEKSYGQYRMNQGTQKEEAFVAQEGADHGGDTEKALSLLTGEECFNSYIHNMNLDLLSLNIINAIKEGKPLTTTTMNTTGSGGEEATKGGFSTGHAFSVVGYDPDGPEGGTLIILDPRNLGGVRQRGRMQISLEQFKENFFAIQTMK